MSLFPQAQRGAEPAGQVAVQFRAGKCTMSSVQSNGKYMVTSDPRSGRLSLSKGGDGLMHFKWTNTVTNKVEDDRIVFPGEYTFKKVKTGITEGNNRVFMLRYQSGEQRLMYWMQDKTDEKDEENVKKMNDFLLNPNAVIVDSAAADAAASAAAGGGGSAVGPEEWMRMIG
jgi:26S proteasome regulatory subunit N13